MLVQGIISTLSSPNTMIALKKRHSISAIAKKPTAKKANMSTGTKYRGQQIQGRLHQHLGVK